MSTHQMQKDEWLSGYSYYCHQKQQKNQTPRKIDIKVDKQNVVPCTALMQSLISTLTHKKYELKYVQAQKKKLKDIQINQKSIIQAQTIKQDYEAEEQINIHLKNKKILSEIQEVKKYKLKHMEKVLIIKNQLQCRYKQILEMKKLKQQIHHEQKYIQEKIQYVSQQNDKLRFHTNDLQLFQQQTNNQLYKMRQTVRQNQVKNTTVQSALESIKKKIIQARNQIKLQNKITKQISQGIVQNNDKIKRRIQQKVQNEEAYTQILYKNKQIQDINIKLRIDLQKCQSHLKCVLKNNDLLQNSIEQFSYVDEKVTRIINRNQLKNI